MYLPWYFVKNWRFVQSAYIYHNTNRVCLFFLKVIQNTIVGLCEDWDELKERTSMRLKLLEESRDIHSFENNVEDTKIWMQEKQGMLMYAVELGKDCASVKKLFRKHEELEVCWFVSWLKWLMLYYWRFNRLSNKDRFRSFPIQTCNIICTLSAEAFFFNMLIIGQRGPLIPTPSLPARPSSPRCPIISLLKKTKSLCGGECHQHAVNIQLTSCKLLQCNFII